MEKNRSSWGSNLGFILAAIGSAVGLGNIWGFPYKMGKSGGFTFLLIYIALSLLVGFIILMTELAVGRKHKLGVVGAYQKTSKRFAWISWMAVLSPFLILSFYTVLGGYCVEYMVYNMSELAFATGGNMAGSELFSSMLTNPWGGLIFTLLYLGFGFLIVKGGISKGIEKFNKIGMPALFIMLIVIIVRSVTLPNASEGLKFMFVPGYAVEAGFIAEEPSFVTVLSTAGGQMFFSLSLAMGIMVTYGSYMNKSENLIKNSAIISFADALAALLAGIAVIPAAVAHGINTGVPVSEIKLGGPSLLFVTLQDVFNSMGTLGALFGMIFYLLVLVAAISSSISLMEVLVTFFHDRAEMKGKKANRNRITTWVSVAILIEAVLVAVDGLGSNGLWVPGQATFGIAGWNDCWLDFMDFLSEGLMMPFGAMLMALMIGWELNPKDTLAEIDPKGGKFKYYYYACIKVIVPIAMAFILAGQIITFLDNGSNTADVTLAAYLISLALLVIFFVVAVIGRQKDKKKALQQ